MDLLKDNSIKFLLFYLSAIVIVISGLKAASDIFMLLFLAIFISSIFSAVLTFFSSKGLPKFLGYMVILLIVVFVFGLFTYIVSYSLKDLSHNIIQYEDKLRGFITNILNGNNTLLGQTIDKDQIIQSLELKPFVNFSASFIGGLSTFFSKFFLLIIGVAFILAESKSFQKKLNIIFRNDKTKLHSFRLFSSNIQKYFLIKTFTSFLTGLVITLILLAFDIQYPILWGVLAFLLNFIPVIGSFVASVPALILSLIFLDAASTIWLAVLYLITNVTVSNILEPKLMGHGLGLSPMLIFFSLIFWGWVLGITGMFLAVPLTMTLKIAFDSAEHTKWLGILFSDMSNKSNKGK